MVYCICNKHSSRCQRHKLQNDTTIHVVLTLMHVHTVGLPTPGSEVESYDVMDTCPEALYVF